MVFVKDINEAHSPTMAEYPLMPLEKRPDFDSPMRRFESSRPTLQCIAAAY
jgi:hypothetical protein